jgi:glycosyltransferase involved in cell wall biosynthesis
MKNVFFLNNIDNYTNFRQPLMDFLIKKEYPINVLFCESIKNKLLLEEKFESLGLDKASLSVHNLLKSIYKLYKNLYKYNNDTKIISFTLYNSLILSLTPIKKVRKISVITGMGTIYQSDRFFGQLRKIIIIFIIAKLSNKIVVQNSDDYKEFFKFKKSLLYKVSGSGVPTNLPLKKNYKLQNKIICVARLITEKGLQELAEGLWKYNSKYPSEKITVDLFGNYDHLDNRAISPERLLMISGDAIVYRGVEPDIAKNLYKYDSLILPSYREGLSKSVIEGLISGLPVLLSRSPGNNDFKSLGFKIDYFNMRCADTLFHSLEEFTSENIKYRTEKANFNTKLAHRKLSNNIIFAKYEDIFYG